jgi:hypothetical protein
MHRRRQAPPPDAYRILAQDGADEDGGTIYYLIDSDDRVLAASAWPQPLENIAHVTGHPVFRMSMSVDGARINDD